MCNGTIDHDLWNMLRLHENNFMLTSKVSNIIHKISVFIYSLAFCPYLQEYHVDFDFIYMICRLFIFKFDFSSIKTSLFGKETNTTLAQHVIVKIKSWNKPKFVQGQVCLHRLGIAICQFKPIQRYCSQFTWEVCIMSPIQHLWEPSRNLLIGNRNPLEIVTLEYLPILFWRAWALMVCLEPMDEWIHWATIILSTHPNSFVMTKGLTSLDDMCPKFNERWTILHGHSPKGRCKNLRVL